MIITAPAKGADIPTYVVGVNEQDYDHDVADIIRSVEASSNHSLVPPSESLSLRYNYIIFR